MAAKRLCVAEGNTPGKPTKKRPMQGKSRRSLFDCSPTAVDDGDKGSVKSDWTLEEKSTLVQYICLFWKNAWNDKWPMSKDEKFWNSCAHAVNKTCNSNRTGASCRTRVTKHLSKEFGSLSEAEESMQVNYVSGSNIRVDGLADTNLPASGTPQQATMVEDPLSPIFKSSPTVQERTVSNLIGDVVKEFLVCFKREMSSRLKTQLLHYLFKLAVLEHGGMEFLKFVNPDFLDKSLNAVETLFVAGKHNIVFNLCECLQRQSPFAKTRLPLDRMPYGLIDYNIRFFASSQTRKLDCEEHYASWLETMFSQFGHKWLCLHRGPVWQYVESEEEIHPNQSLLEMALDASGINLEAVIDDGAASGSLSESDIELSLPSTCMDSSCSEETMEHVNSVFTHLSVSDCQVEVFKPANVEPYFMENIQAKTVSENLPDNIMLSVPNLWTHVRKDAVQEIVSGMNNPKEMEKHHGILPNLPRKVKRNSGIFDPLKGKVNVAAIGVRQIQKRVLSSGFTKGAEIQINALKQAHVNNPAGRWWIKADACDLRKGLRESMLGCWEGDVDLGDGLLQMLFEEYQARCKFVRNIGTEQRLNFIQADVMKVKVEIEQDLVFLTKGSEEVCTAYNKACESGSCAEGKLMELAWSVAGFQELLKKAKALIVELDGVLYGLCDGQACNLIKLKSIIVQYVKDLFSKKRVPASYLLVFMISDELRNKKPYAIPVQFVPYKSIADSDLRNLEVKVEDAMKGIGMRVVGFTTDGEFNSLRTCGKSRPISLIEIIKLARQEARSTRKDTLLRFFKLDSQGNPLEGHAAIPIDDLLWLDSFMNSSDLAVPFEKAIYILRRKLFPFMHDPYPWVEGRPETPQEVLKSIFAVYLYRKKISDLQNIENDPADFDTYLYQPEKDATGEYIHHREDHNHLLKRVVSCLRDGRIPGIDLRHLRDALHDSSTGLTYEALTGKNKQSVPDCERLVGPGVISFVESKGHASGAKVLRLIHNWHKAVDGRGLSETVRAKYCNEMKTWILEDWMPWYKFLPNYSTIDVNRPLKGICGLTREVIVGLVANLESRQIRRQEHELRQLPAEHPRASATDDVESMFSLLHEMLGDIFDLKQFHEAQAKILNEFNKKINPDLKFFYWTGAKERFTEFELPSFNKPSGEGVTERLDKVKLSRRGDPGVFVANRASLPQKGQLTTRAKFHRAPVELPPQMK